MPLKASSITRMFLHLGIQTVASSRVQAEEGVPGNSQRDLEVHAVVNMSIIFPIKQWLHFL